LKFKIDESHKMHNNKTRNLATSLFPEVTNDRRLPGIEQLL